MQSEPRSSNNSPENRPGTDEKIGSLFQPDTLLVEQYLENFRRRMPLEPEKALMLAVLEEAIDCYRDNVAEPSGKKKRLFEEAEQWILKEDGDWVFSFESICEVLGTSPEYVRQGLIRWKRQNAAGARKKRLAPEWRSGGEVPAMLKR